MPDQITHTAEKDLFVRIADGDEAAFRDLYRSYGRLLFPFLVRLTASHDLADEIIQEVFLRVWFSRDRLPAVEHPRAYIFRIASNRAFEWLRKDSRLPVTGIADAGEDVTEPETVEARLTIKAMKEVVQQAVSELSPQRMAIYRLSREQGLKPAEIAAQMDLSVSTVKNTLVSATKFIRERLEGAGYLGVLLLFTRF